MRRNSQEAVRRVLVAVVLAVVATGCARAIKPPAYALVLPEEYNTPDGMTIDKDGNILLSCPNTNNQEHGAKILKIDKDENVSEVVALPVHPVTKKPAGPLGIAEGPDGHLYVADNQSFVTSEIQSRLLRVVMKGGKAQKVEVVATNLFMANGVACHGDSVYVVESNFDPAVKPIKSGVYRFKIADLKGDKPIEVKGADDPHVCARILTKNPDWVGANGLGFDAEGRMYLCNFGDAMLHRFTFDKEGKIARSEVVAVRHGMESCDGMCVDRETGDVYIADFLGNAVHKVCPKTGTVTTVAKNGNTKGKDGLLDKPSEPCVRGNKLYVSNIDLPLAGNKYDEPHTISVIELSK